MKTRGKTTKAIKRAAFGLAAVIILAGAGCPKKELLYDTTLSKALGEAGWTSVDFPRELLGAGTIVSITQSQGITYRGHLKDCVSAEQFESRFGLKRGNAGLEGKIKTSYKLDISALLNYQSIEVGPSFNSLKNFTVTMGPTREEALSDILVRNWIRANWDGLTPACKNYLRGYEGEKINPQETVFVLTDVLGAQGYTYSFETTSGAKVSLSPANLGQYFKVGGSAGLGTTASGDLKSDGFVYIAFKAAISPFAATQGAAPALSATDLMQARNRALHGSD